MLFKSRLINILIISLVGLLGGLFGSFFYYSTLVPVGTEEGIGTSGARILFREPFRDSRVYSPSDVARLNVYVSQSIVSLYLKKTSGSDAINTSYLPHERLGIGFVLTADGWVMVQHGTVKKFTPDRLLAHIGKEFVSVEKIIQDPVRSIAYVKIKTDNLSVLKFADSDEARFGDQFFIVAGKNKVTAASVSSLYRNDEATRASLVYQSERLTRLMGLEPALREEFVGAPVVTTSGEVVGIVVRPDSRGEALAIPINNMRRSLRELLQGKKFSSIYLGLSYLDLNQEYIADTPHPNGFLVYENAALGANGVQKGGPADKAGIRLGDILVRINDQDVRGPLTLSEILDDFESGEEITVTVVREGKEIALKVLLGEK